MTSSQGQALESALVADPDDLAAHAAYADWLVEQGHPRGEFIQVQLALEDARTPPDDRPRLRARERELLDRHEHDWLGGLAPFLLARPKGQAAASWRWLGRFADFIVGAAGSGTGHERPAYQYARGWLHSMTVPDLGEEDDTLARALAAAPELRLLQRLVIDYDQDDLLSVLESSAHLGNLRVFQLGERSYADVSGAGLIPFLRDKRHLEELNVTGTALNVDALFALPLPRLRVLQVDHIRHYPLRRLADNPSLANLSRISCWPHAVDAGETEAYIGLDEVRPLLGSPNLPSLTDLELHLTSMGDPGCEAIVQSGMLGRLKVLDLSHGCITDAGARALAACPDLPKLKLLNLEANGLTASGIAALESAGLTRATEQAERGRLRADRQHPNDPHDYLYEGDIE